MLVTVIIPAHVCLWTNKILLYLQEYTTLVHCVHKLITYYYKFTIKNKTENNTSLKRHANERCYSDGDFAFTYDSQAPKNWQARTVLEHR
jgi:outer membrane lipoprotein-sorting protein